MANVWEDVGRSGGWGIVETSFSCYSICLLTFLHTWFLFCIFIFENVIYVYMSYDNKMHPQSPQIPLYLLKMLLQSFSFLSIIPLSGTILAKECGHRISLGMGILQVATFSIRNDSSFSSNYPVAVAPQ